MSRKALRGPLGLFLAMAGLIIASTLVTYIFGYRVIQLRAGAALRRHIIAQVETTLSTLKDAETGQRGFIITGDDAYLEPYREALRRLPGELFQLSDQDAAEGVRRELPVIRDLTAAELKEMKAVMEIRRDAGFEAAAVEIRKGAGKQ